MQVSSNHPLRRLFTSAVTRRFYDDAQLRDSDIAGYVAALLIDFVHINNLYKILDAKGKRLEDVGEMLIESILSRRAAERGFFQPRYVRRLVDEHLRGKRDHALLLWSLLIFERFLQIYVDSVSGSAVHMSEPQVPLIPLASAR